MCVWGGGGGGGGGDGSVRSSVIGCAMSCDSLGRLGSCPDGTSGPA